MWQLKENVASFVAEPFRIEVNVARPVDGLTSIRGGKLELPVYPLQISAQPTLLDQPEPIEEVYVRGDDLIATYRLASARTALPQIVWTAAVDDGAFSLDLTIAMQTPLLASDPRITSVTTAKAEEILMAVGTADDFCFQAAAKDSRGACGLFVFRLTESDFSYAEMVYPPDFDAGELSYGNGRLEYRLICEPLEKGVIRKAQLRCMIVPRQSDTELAATGFRALSSAAPPLTT